MNRILITINHFHELKGSEIVTLEIAETFLNLGWHVTIYTNLFLPPLSLETLKLPHQERLYIPTEPNEDMDQDFDIIWIQHNLLPPSLIRSLMNEGIKSYIIWHHMSSYIHIELPLLHDIENTISDVVTVISEEVKNRVIDFGIKREKIIIFDNPAIDTFAFHPKKNNVNSYPNSLALVSNHLTTEVKEAAKILNHQGITVYHFGEGGQSKRITPEDLYPFDAVLTIGKTVQYALSLGIPVYEYDHFGGAGWITKNNIINEAKTNFSGRTTSTIKTGSLIAEEIITNFSTAKIYAEENAFVHAEKYRLSNQLSKILQQLPEIVESKKLSTIQALQFEALAELHRGLYRTMMYFKNKTH
ncbi:glycosyltransferase [Lelliottia amnigena]